MLISYKSKTLRKTCHCEEVRRSNLLFYFQYNSFNNVDKLHHFQNFSSFNEGKSQVK
jgi:hypothetical protein